jgi:hypothetical protein
VHPLGQDRELLLSLVGLLMSLHLPDLKAGQLLAGGAKLSLLLMSSGKLCGQPLVQSRLLGETVPCVLLVMEELRLPLAVSHEGLWRGCKLEARRKNKSQKHEHVVPGQPV